MIFKRYIVITLTALLISCGGEAPRFKERDMNYEISAEPEATVLNEAEAYTSLLKRRLSEQLERIQLAREYPEFGSTTTDSTLFKVEIMKDARLESLRILDQENLKDTLKILFQFKLGQSKGELTDTLKATIISREQLLDGQSFLTRELVLSPK